MFIIWGSRIQFPVMSPFLAYKQKLFFFSKQLHCLSQGLNPWPLDDVQDTLPLSYLNLLNVAPNLLNNIFPLHKVEKKIICLDQGLNPGPLGYEHVTLSTELLGLVDKQIFLAEPWFYCMYRGVVNRICFFPFFLCTHTAHTAHTAHSTCSGCTISQH